MGNPSAIFITSRPLRTPLRFECKQSSQRSLHKLQRAFRIETLRLVTAQFVYVDALLLKANFRRMNKAIDLKSQEVRVGDKWMSGLTHGLVPAISALK